MREQRIMREQRTDKVASLIHEIVAAFIQQEANPSPLITVTHVSLSKDCKRGVVHVTTIPDTGENDALIFLKRKASEIRTMVKQKSKIGNIPHLEFTIDAGERHRQHMDEIMRNIASKDQ